MSDAIAYRLKQIMTNDHLNLAQAAKQIGISPTSMRKVLNNKELSQPVMMKINRFIDAHPISANERRSFTIFPSDESAQANDKKMKQAKKAESKPEKKADEKTDKKAPKKKAANEALDKGAKKQNEPQKAGKKQADQPEKDGKQQRGKKTAEPASKKASKTATSTRNDAEKKAIKANKNAEKKTAKKADKAKPAEKAASQTTKRKANDKLQQKKADAVTSDDAKQKNAKQDDDKKQNRRARGGRRSQSSQSVAAQPSESASSSASLSTKTTAAETNKTDNHFPSTHAASVPATSTQASTSDNTEKDDAQGSGLSSIQIFIDESFASSSDYQRAMSIGATVIADSDDTALNQFIQTLYPFGWMPGDEVKARGKAADQIARVLHLSHSDSAPAYAIYSPLSDAGNFSLGFGVLYPYVAAILRILDQLPTLPGKVRIALDKRNEITDDKLGMGARLLHAYVKAQTGQDVIFLMRTADSKDNPGLQYADFISHAALHFGQETMQESGIKRLTDVGSDAHDNLTLFAMVGLQKYLIDDQISSNAPHLFHNDYLTTVARTFNLISRATTLADVSDETLAQAKNILSQLLQIAPASVTGAVTNMPFKSWYDLAARAAVILHFSDETLPSFDADQDALDAVNTQLNALASALTLG